MKGFRYAQAHDVGSAMATVAADPAARYVAGGTNVIDLMKEYVEQPSLLVDITRLPLRGIDPTPHGVRVGALALMSDVADHPMVARDFPAVSQALLLSASPQLRNMATVGGNVMQRTRCAYFRDASQPCNKRAPGTGCPAIGGVNRQHAVIGGSEHCICTNPSDLAVALLAVDAVVHVRGGAGERAIPFERFHVLPGATPQRETVLERGDLITAVELPASAHARGSYYLKVRDRASYEFALVSVAAALDVAGGRIRSARVALGGVSPKPWRSHAAEPRWSGARQPRARSRRRRAPRRVACGAMVRTTSSSRSHGTPSRARWRMPEVRHEHAGRRAGRPRRRAPQSHRRGEVFRRSCGAESRLRCARAQHRRERAHRADR